MDKNPSTPLCTDDAGRPVPPIAPAPPAVPAPPIAPAPPAVPVPPIAPAPPVVPPTPIVPLPPVGGELPEFSIDPALLSLAMGFVPYQAWETPYEPDIALRRGTIFPSLDKPFIGEEAVRRD